MNDDSNIDVTNAVISTETSISTDSVVTAESNGLDRRSMFGKVGAGAAGAVALGALAASGLSVMSKPAEAQTVTDSDILNFALNLEYLEAEYYLRAALGSGLSASDVTGLGTQGTVTGGSAVPFKSVAIQGYAQRLAVDEQQHVRFLRSALGSAAVAEPRIDFAAAFTNLAVAAGLIVAGQTFNPFADDFSFLLGAFVFEDVGVTAYNGAATLISSKGILQAAASILAIEAYHAGSIRTLLANIGAGVSANAVAALRGQLGGGKEQGILIPGLNFNAVAADNQSLAFTRTTTQVLNIVYGGSTGGGLFFPSGMNGLIK